MRFSTAVALGLPEIRFTNDYWFNPADCSGCLVGAALKAEECQQLENGVLPTFCAYWPWMKDWRAPDSAKCPVCGSASWGICGESAMWNICTHLANHYEAKEITAERVIDYIRALEPDEPDEQLKEQPKVEEEVVAGEAA